MSTKRPDDYAGIPCQLALPLIINKNGASALFSNQKGETRRLPLARSEQSSPQGLQFDLRHPSYASTFFHSLMEGVPRPGQEPWLLACYEVMRDRAYWPCSAALEQRLADIEASKVSPLPPPRSPAYPQ